MNDTRSPTAHLAPFDSVAYFRALTQRNRLCRQLRFAFGQCAGLQGFYDMLAAASASPNHISIDDSSEGYITTSGKLRTIKTVYLAMRHRAAGLQERAYCLEQMREIFRQFLSHLIRQKVRLEEQMIEFDGSIQFSEIDSSFCTGAACAFFNIAIDQPINLCFNEDEWD